MSDLLATNAFTVRDTSKDPHPTPCADCGREHLRGDHLVFSETSGAVIWEGCSRCWIKRTDPARMRKQSKCGCNKCERLAEYEGLCDACYAEGCRSV